MLEAMTALWGATLAIVVSTVVSSGIFGVSIWVYVPAEESPFADGVGSGLTKCTVFSVAAFLLLMGLIFLLGLFGLGLWIIIFFLGMRRVFDCGIFDTIIIIIINFAVSYGLGWLIGNFFP
jgi:hypothetical protein